MAKAELKSIIETREMVSRILADREKETEEITGKVKDAQKAVDAAKYALETAITSGDLKTYQAAKAQLREAEDAREMYEARLEALHNKPLITKERYEKAVAAIYSEVAAADDQTKQALVKLSDQMNTLASTLETMLNDANSVLHVLQHDIYRDADMMRNANGEVYGRRKEIDKWKTVSWGKAGVNHDQYSEYTGRKVK